MKKLLLAPLAGAALLAGGASNAADLGIPPIYKARPMEAPVPVFTWTGCYVGIEGGRATGDAKHTAVTSSNPARIGLTIAEFDLKGWLIGGTLGCNYQIASNWVIGIEDDLSWTDKRGSANDIAPFTKSTVTSTKERWLDTLRGRIGFAWDRVLIYGTGGAAFVGTTVDVVDRFNNSVSDSRTRTGWTAGGGIEWAMWNNLSLKVEYLHADFGTAQYISPPVKVPQGGTFVTRAVPLTDDLVRIGLNYKF